MLQHDKDQKREVLCLEEQQQNGEQLREAQRLEEKQHEKEQQREAQRFEEQQQTEEQQRAAQQQEEEQQHAAQQQEEEQQREAQWVTGSGTAAASVRGGPSPLEQPSAQPKHDPVRWAGAATAAATTNEASAGGCDGAFPKQASVEARMHGAGCGAGAARPRQQ